jgi:hypothetical protein
MTAPNSRTIKSDCRIPFFARVVENELKSIRNKVRQGELMFTCSFKLLTLCIVNLLNLPRSAWVSVRLGHASIPSRTNQKSGRNAGSGMVQVGERREVKISSKLCAIESSKQTASSTQLETVVEQRRSDYLNTRRAPTLFPVNFRLLLASDN